MENFVKQPGKLVPDFFTKIVKDPEASREAGRPIHKEVPYVNIYVPGDKSSVISLPLQKEQKMQEFFAMQEGFEKAFRNWQEGQEPAEEGTRLEEMPWISRAQVEDLKHFKVRTLEQLAALSDTVCQSLGLGATDLRKRAQAQMEVYENNGDISGLVEENRRLRNDLDSKEKQIQDLASRVGKLESNDEKPESGEKPKRRSRAA